MADADPGFAVYVHWPFCAAKCPYCDFNSHVRHDPPDQARFLTAFARELEWTSTLTGRRAVASIFFGGGTPSLMAPETVGGILEAIGRHHDLAPDVEITLEANPGSVEADRFAGYRAAGVNRVSLGIQSLHDEALRQLGRIHTADEARRALDIAARTFKRFSFDLIYARPGQTPESWRDELTAALALGSDHLSLYQLTIEPDTMFMKLLEAGKLTLPDPDTARAFWDVTQDTCNAAGLPAYEVSNHARPGAECRHNLVYWRSGSWIGIGPGAHGRLNTAAGRMATATERTPEDWLSLVERQGHGVITQEMLLPEEQADELLLMGLRLTEGIDPERYRRLAGRPLKDRFIGELTEQGLIERTTSGRLRVTPAGFPLLDAVVADLAA